MSKWRNFREDVADELADLRVQLDTRAKDQNLLLRYIESSSVQPVRRLIDRGVSPDFANKDGETPLHVAAVLPPTPESMEILELLVFVGAPLERRNRFGLCPLHVASKVSAKVVNLFLDAGASINCQDNAGRTSLMLACESASQESLIIVMSLLDRGANPHLKDGDGKTALNYTVSTRDRDMILRTEVIYRLLFAGCLVNTQVSSRECSPIMEEIGSMVLRRHELNIQEPHLFDVMKALVRGGADGRNIYHYLPIYSMLVVECSDILKNVFQLLEPLTSASEVRKLSQLITVTQQQMQSESLKAFIDILKQSSRTVRTLKCASRIVVRRELRGKIFLNVDKLDLPKYLEDYLTYSECV